eukprot:m.225804 g.225804  ORF g.225804 m.225804 type:complete len:761 (+) comp18786_c1_seq2:159-2441(+)
MGQVESSASSDEVRVVVDQQETGTWALLRSHSEDGEPITIFEHDPKGSSKATTEPQRKLLAEAISNGSQRLRGLRHPGILKYQWAQEEAGVVSMITETATPLLVVADNEPLYMTDVAVGLHSVLEALAFLHDTCHLAHNNLSTRAVFVTDKPGTRWKLGCLELTQPASFHNPEFFKSVKFMRSEAAQCPEDLVKGTAPLHARDVYALGELACELAEIVCDGDGDVLLDAFLQTCRTALQGPVQKRPRCKQLLQHDFFRENPLVRALIFLDSITVQSEPDKARFFRTLGLDLKRVPSACVARHLIGLVLEPVMFAESGFLDFLPHLVLPTEYGTATVPGLLTEADIEAYVVPRLVELFAVHDVSVRVALLRTLPLYMSAVSDEVLLNTVLPEVRLGLQCPDTAILEATFHGLGDLVPRCGSAVTGFSLFARPLEFANSYNRRSAQNEQTAGAPPNPRPEPTRSATAVKPLQPKAARPVVKPSTPPTRMQRKTPSPPLPDPPLPTEMVQANGSDVAWEEDEVDSGDGSESDWGWDEQDGQSQASGDDEHSGGRVDRDGGREDHGLQSPTLPAGESRLSLSTTGWDSRQDTQLGGAAKPVSGADPPSSLEATTADTTDVALEDEALFADMEPAYSEPLSAPAATTSSAPSPSKGKRVGFEDDKDIENRVDDDALDLFAEMEPTYQKPAVASLPKTGGAARSVSSGARKPQATRKPAAAKASPSKPATKPTPKPKAEVSLSMDVGADVAADAGDAWSDDDLDDL